MGGIGSTRWVRHRKAITVGECWAINIETFRANGWFIKTGQAMNGNISWNNANGEVTASIGIALQLADSNGYLDLSYFVSDPGIEPIQVAYQVELQTTRPYFGGLRWWFTCPACERRVAKLYQPPQADQFLCRICHKLSYTSSQESDKRVNKLRKLGLKAILEFMQDGSPSDLILGLKALRGWI